MTDLLDKYLSLKIKQEVADCVDGKCREIENEVIPRELDKWHENYSHSQQSNEVDYCGYCSYSAPGVGKIERGTQGCNHS